MSRDLCIFQWLMSTYYAFISTTRHSNSVILLVDLHLLPLHSRVLALFVHTCVYTLADGIFNEQLSYRALYTLKCFAFSLYRTILDFVDDRSWEFNEKTVFNVLLPFFINLPDIFNFYFFQFPNRFISIQCNRQTELEMFFIL